MDSDCETGDTFISWKISSTRFSTQIMHQIKFPHYFSNNLLFKHFCQDKSHLHPQNRHRCKSQTGNIFHSNHTVSWHNNTYRLMLMHCVVQVWKFTRRLRGVEKEGVGLRHSEWHMNWMNWHIPHQRVCIQDTQHCVLNRWQNSCILWKSVPVSGHLDEIFYHLLSGKVEFTFLEAPAMVMWHIIIFKPDD